MPLRRRVMRKKRSYTRKRRTTVRKLYKMVRRQRPEMKRVRFAHTALGQNPFSPSLSQVNFASPVSYDNGTKIAALCSSIPQGVGDSNRVGSKITLRGVHIDLIGQIKDGLTSFNTYQQLRLLLISPKRHGPLLGGAPDAQTFSQRLFTNVSGELQWAAPVDTDNFRVLYDKRVYLTWKPTVSAAQNLSYSAPSVRRFRKFVRFNKTIQWPIGSSILAQNDVYLVAISDDGESANTGSPGFVAGFVNIYYTDA